VVSIAIHAQTIGLAPARIKGYHAKAAAKSPCQAN
jgi:hypothetical protein